MSSSILARSFRQWRADRAPQLAASTAYYAAFSLAPLLLLVLGVAGFAFGTEIARRQMLTLVQATAGSQVAIAIAFLLGAVRTPGSSFAAAIIGIVLLVVGATGLLASLQGACNSIWKVKAKSSSAAVWLLLWKRLVSFLVLLVFGFLFAASVVLSTAALTLVQSLAGVAAFLPLANLAITYAVSLLLFVILLRFLPDVRVPWRDAWAGAALTALLFLIGQQILAWYFGFRSASSGLGAAGSLLVLLLWIYYSAQIFFFGVEYTRVHASARHREVRPRRYAVFTEPPEKPLSRFPDPATILGVLMMEWRVFRWYRAFRRWRRG
jgi:membrane protein